MKNQDRAPQKALPKHAGNQTESPTRARRDRRSPDSLRKRTRWTGKTLDPLLPGRFRPTLNERQACGIIALAIVGARRDLEAFCAECMDAQLYFKGGRVAESIAMAHAVVKACALQSLELDLLVKADPEIIPFYAPGLAGVSPLSWEEALGEMAGMLLENSDELRCHAYTDTSAYAGLAEAITLSEEVYALNNLTTERKRGRGSKPSNSTLSQRNAWIAQIAVHAGQCEPWRRGPGQEIREAAAND